MPEVHSRVCREPHVVGTRLLVRQIMATVKGHHGNINDSASYLDIPPGVVRAAVSYYAAFTKEVDDDTHWAARIETDERARWEREQATIA